MQRLGLLGVAVVLPLLHAEQALGCGPTLEFAELVLPEFGAMAVPTDAAFFVASSSAVRWVTLRPVEPGATSSDSGSSIEAALTCYDAPGGTLCVGKPTQELAPNTLYEWSAATEAEDTPELDVRIASQRFSTSGGRAPTGRPKVRASVSKYEVFDEPDECSISAFVVVQLVGEELTGPVVVGAAGITPNYDTPLVVLTPGAFEQSLTIYDPPECFTLEVFDVTGKRDEVGEICPERAASGGAGPGPQPAPSESQDEPATTIDVDAAPGASGGETSDQGIAAATNDVGQPDAERNAIVARSDSGCALTNPSDRGAWFAVFGLMALGASTAWRRRGAGAQKRCIAAHGCKIVTRPGLRNRSLPVSPGQPQHVEKCKRGRIESL